MAESEGRALLPLMTGRVSDLIRGLRDIVALQTGTGTEAGGGWRYEC